MKPRLLLRVIVPLITYLLPLTTSVGYAEVPHLIRYQGTAVDAKGVPLEGPYTLTFRLYSAETAGTKLWEETQPNVPLSKGHFSVLLGQVTPLNADWSKPLWLSVQVNTDSELAPRQRITSVPLAVRAELAETAQMATVAQSAQNMKTSSLQDDVNRLVPSGAVILWTGASCPAGYTRFSALDGKFLVGSSTYSASAGGTNTITPSGSVSVAPHSHTVPASQPIWGMAMGHGGGGYVITLAPNENAARATNDASTSSVAPSASFSGNAFDNRPEFATMLLCQKN